MFVIWGEGVWEGKIQLFTRWLRKWQQAVTRQDLVKKAEMHPKASHQLAPVQGTN